MKIEIKSGDEWMPVLVVSAKRFPLIKVAHDPSCRWHQALVASNMKISTLRIDGIEGRYGIDFDDCPRMAPDCITFNWLSVCKAIKIPDGSHVTTASGIRILNLA